MKDRASHVSYETPFSLEVGLNVDLYDIARFFSKVSVGKDDECWKWNGRTNGTGYGRITIRGFVYLSHRFSYMLAKGKIHDNSLVVRHKCDNRRCVNPNHLETGSHTENMVDRQIRDRTARGERNGRSKLTANSVRKIRADTRSNSKIAKDYGVRKETIQLIKARKSWAHVSDTPPNQRQ